MAKAKKHQRVAGESSGGASSVQQSAPPRDAVTVTPASDGAADETVTLDPSLAPVSGRFGIGAYLLFNVIFGAFCLLQLLLVRVQLGEQKGLYFFFALLMGAFFVVSVFDYLYDRYIDPAPETAEERL